MIKKKIKLLIRHPLYVVKKVRPTRIIYKMNYQRFIKKYQDGSMEEQLELYPLLNGDKLEDFSPLLLPQCENPKVSIIIPVYNQFPYTYNCIKSIIKNTKNVDYEVILADDCSNDLTQNIDKVIMSLRVIRNNKNLKFLLNCNNAAKYAKGDYIVFLNNDTQVQEEWLTNMLNLMEKSMGIGMTGAKLVYPNGKLQEAGGVVLRDGSALNFGNGCNPMDAIFCKVRDVDYISGAAIMILKDLWNQIGGFDQEFSPAYYEDTDLAFCVRKAGYRVVLQPASVVVHFEGMSNGIDILSGIKENQIINERKFYPKWKAVLKKKVKWSYHEV